VLAIFIDSLVIDPGLLNFDRAYTRLNRPGRQVAVSDNQPVVLVIPDARMTVQIFGDFVLNDLSQHLLCPLPQDVGQNIPAGY
jgi:hypothetical protein